MKNVDYSEWPFKIIVFGLIIMITHFKASIANAN